MSKQQIFVFGGSSPIAIGCSMMLQDKGAKVFHFSRDPKQVCFDELRKKGIQVIKMDLNKDDLEMHLIQNLEQLIIDIQPSGILFAHRSKNNDIEKAFYSEVVAPNKILNMLSDLVNNSKKSVLFLTSPAGSFVQQNQNVSYHVIKAAQLQLAKYFAANFSKFQIRVNCLAPGAFVEKERSREFYAQHRRLVNKINSGIPLGRFATIDEIAEVALFLLDDKSSYVNGEEIYLDGGLSRIDQSQFLI